MSLDTVLKFLETSEKRQHTEARQRLLVMVGVPVVLAIGGIVAALISWTFYLAAVNERAVILTAQSKFLARDAGDIAEDGDAVTGMLLSLEALPKEIAHADRPFVNDAEYSLEEGAANQHERRVFTEHQDNVSSATFSPDDRRVVSASYDKTVRVWNANTGKLLLLIRGSAGMNTAEFSPDGRLIVTASSDHTVRVWDAATGKQLKEVTQEAPVTSAAFSPNALSVVTSSFDKTVQVWNVEDGRRLLVLHGHGAVVTSARFSPDGHRIVSASYDKSVRIWDASTGAVLKILRGHQGGVTSASFSPNGRQIVSGSWDRTIRLWNAASGTQTGQLVGHIVWVTSTTFSPDGRLIVSASGDKTIRLWDAQRARQLLVLKGHDGFVNSAAFSSDGRSIVSASRDKTVRVWTIKPKAEVRVYQASHIPLIFAEESSDGRWITALAADKSLVVWNARTGRRWVYLSGTIDGTGRGRFAQSVRSTKGEHGEATLSDEINAESVPSPGQKLKEWIRSALRLSQFPDSTYSSDGHYEARSEHGTLLVQESRGAFRRLISDPRVRLSFPNFSPDGSTVSAAAVSSSESHPVPTIRLWNVRSGQQVGVLKGHEQRVLCAAFSPDGKQIVSASADDSIRIWDVVTGKQRQLLVGHTSRVNFVAFSQDGQRVISASGDNTIRVWKAATGAQIIVLHGHEASVNSATFSGDGRQVISASDDSTVRLWNMPPRDQALIDVANTQLPRRLSDKQREREFLQNAQP